MENNPFSSSIVKIHSAFTKPTVPRCFELSKLLDEISIKELQNVLPLLIDNIFGCNGQPGWELASYRTHSQEYREIRSLLSPTGKFLNAIYRLTLDPFVHYELPVLYLPLTSQKMMDEGCAPSLYAEKLLINQAGQPVVSLNAFEYYFMHFAHYVVGPTFSKSGDCGESVYPMVLDDYLNYFLPLSGKCGPLPISSHMTQASYYHPSPQSSHRHLSPSIHRHLSPGMTSSMNVTQTSQSRSPFRGLLKIASSSNNSMSSGPGISNMMTDYNSTEQETWQSTTFLQILVEFWVHSVGITNNKVDFHTTESYLPGPEHVKLVRMLIKHLHTMSLGSSLELIPSPYTSHIVSPWDQFKKNALERYVDRPLFTFFKHCFEHWPLDSSFRLVLETWLSFIQPWRYNDPSGSRHSRDVDETGLDSKWGVFVAEKLLFYTVLLQSFIERCLRVDLATPKNAHMLFRTAKVFSVYNLNSMIRAAEGSMCEPLLNHTDLSSNTIHSHHSATEFRHRRQGIPNMTMNLNRSQREGGTSLYNALFSENVLDLVGKLLQHIYIAKESVNRATQKTADKKTSFFSSFGLSADFNALRLVGAIQDDQSEDVSKLAQYLENAEINLCNFFKLEKANAMGMDKSIQLGVAGTFGINQQGVENLAPDVCLTDNGLQLSPLGRYQIANGLRKFEVTYETDPDLQPIRTFENAALVRMLYSLTNFFNTKYDTNLKQLYSEKTFRGAFARQFITLPYPNHEPSTISQCDLQQCTPPKHHSTDTTSVYTDNRTANNTLSPHILRQRQRTNTPRISLRWLASYNNLAVLLILYLLLSLWAGVNVVSFVLLMLLFTALYGCVMAVFRPRLKAKVH